MAGVGAVWEELSEVCFFEPQFKYRVSEIDLFVDRFYNLFLGQSHFYAAKIRFYA